MEGRQIVALKMRIRFSSITPASSSARAVLRFTFCGTRETSAHSALRIVKAYIRSHKPNR